MKEMSRFLSFKGRETKRLKSLLLLLYYTHGSDNHPLSKPLFFFIFWQMWRSKLLWSPSLPCDRVITGYEDVLDKARPFTLGCLKLDVHFHVCTKTSFFQDSSWIKFESAWLLFILCMMLFFGINYLFLSFLHLSIITLRIISCVLMCIYKSNKVQLQINTQNIVTSSFCLKAFQV